MASHWENHFGYHPSGAREMKRSCSQPAWGGLFFLNCFSAEQLFYQYPDLRGCQRRVKNRKRDEASFWELPLLPRHRNMCYSLPLWQTWTTWLSPPTHACQLVVFLSFSIKLVEPAPEPLHQILLLAWCHLLPCLSAEERVVPSAGKGPASLTLRYKRLHSEEQVVPHPISALDGLYTALFCLKLGNSALLAIRGALLLNHQIVWLNIKLWLGLSKHHWSWMESHLGCGLMNENPKN